MGITRRPWLHPHGTWLALSITDPPLAFHLPSSAAFPFSLQICRPFFPCPLEEWANEVHRLRATVPPYSMLNLSLPPAFYGSSVHAKMGQVLLAKMSPFGLQKYNHGGSIGDSGLSKPALPSWHGAATAVRRSERGRCQITRMKAEPTIADEVHEKVVLTNHTSHGNLKCLILHALFS